MKYILQTETEASQRPTQVLSEASHLHNLLHRFTFYYKIHIFYCFLFVINWNTTCPQTGRQEAFFPKSVVWEHSEGPSVHKRSVAFQPEATVAVEPSYNPTHAYTDSERTWVKTASCCPLPLSNYTKVKAQYKPFSI